MEPAEQSFLDAGIRAAVEEPLRRKAEARHWAYTPIPVTSQRYRFVSLTSGETAVKAVNANGIEEGTYYSLNGMKVDNPSKGLYIKKW